MSSRLPKPTAEKAEPSRHAVRRQFNAIIAEQFWLGPGGVHDALDGHEQWVIDNFKDYCEPHSAGEEENSHARQLAYAYAQHMGYIRGSALRRGEAIELSASQKYPLWEYVPPAFQLAVQELAAKTGRRVLFDGWEVWAAPSRDVIPEPIPLPDKPNLQGRRRR